MSTRTPRPLMRRVLVFVTLVVVGIGGSIADTATRSVVSAAAAAAPHAGGDPGPPSWLRPGIRLTYRSAQASTAGSTSTSGGGITEITVLHVDRSSVIAKVDLLADPADPNGLAGVLATTVGPLSTSDGEYWKHPSVLAELAVAPTAGVKVSVGPYRLGATTYEAIALERTDPTSSARYTYDKKSGLLLGQSFQTTRSVPVSPTEAARLETSKGTALLQRTRRVTFPWASAPGASWAPPVRSMAVAIRSVESMPGIGDSTSSSDAVVTMVERGGDYVVWKLSPTASADGITFAGGPAVLDPFWLPPTSLGTLQPGQILDVDPTSGQRLTVRSVDQASVTITLELTGQRSDLTYDRRTGLLQRSAQTTRTSVSVRTISLTVLSSR